MSLVPNFFDDNDFFSLRQNMPSRKIIKYPTFDLDVKETNNYYIVTADLPGVEKKNIDIKLDNNILTISSLRKNERKEINEKIHYFERSYGNSSRTIYLSSKVNFEDIIATYKDGVLNLVISKKNQIQ